MSRTLVEPDPNAPTLPLHRGSPSPASPVSLTSLEGPALPDIESGVQRYAWRGILGEGGMGEVRLCRDERIGRYVAMKTIRPEIAGHAELRKRFVREARVQGQLEHPAIVPVYDVDTGDDGTFFTMKRVRGHTLEEVIAALAHEEPAFTESYSLRRLLTAFNQAALAVAFAHSRGVVHRDLKPGNLMLGDFGEVYVLDWGIAKVRGDADATGPALHLDLPSVETLTSEGVVFGTPGYMAPEQIRGEALDERADVYALGVILFEVLALSRLHPTTVEAAIVSTLAGPDARPSQRSKRPLPPELDAICVRATALTPGERHATVRQLVDDIERYLDGDRDLARRRELADELLARADSLMEQGEADARGEAMRAVGQSIALDPSNQRAVALMTRMLLEPPKVSPPEVEQKFRESMEEERRATARFGALAFAAWIVLSPLLVFVGVRMWWAVLSMVGLSLVCVAISWWLSLPGRVTTDARGYALLGVSTAAIAAGSLYLGPFVLAVAMAAQNTAVFAVHARRGLHRLLTIAIGLLGALVPLLLEWMGLFPPSFAFRDGNLVLFPRMADFPPGATTWVLVIAMVALVAIPSLSISRTADEGTEAKRRLFIHLWHLRNLVPREALGVTSTDATAEPA